MTLANKITIVRILLIPVFVMLAVYYGEGLHNGNPDERLRLAAILVFLVAAVSDGLDGYVARRYNQRSKLGTILDPIADKGLLLAGLLTLTFSDWGYRLHYLNGDVHVRPRWTGKIATVLQMIALGWVMLQLRFVRPAVPVALAGLFTLISGIGYVLDGIRQLGHHAQPAVETKQA